MTTKKTLYFTPIDLNALCDRDKRNVAIAMIISNEPGVLEWDLTKTGTIEALHYHDDLFWIMNALEEIKTPLSEITLEISFGKITVWATYNGKHHVYHTPGATSIVGTLWMALSDFSLWALLQRKST